MMLDVGVIGTYSQIVVTVNELIARSFVKECGSCCLINVDTGCFLVCVLSA